MGTLEDLIATYGPAIVLVGTFLEGETIVVIAGFLSHQGVINPLVVALSAFTGSFLGDQLWFFLARRHANHRYIIAISRRPVFEKVKSAIEDHPKKFILSFRFIYGIRTVSPVAIGLTRINAGEFLLLNAIAAAIWAIAFTALGFLFGTAAETLLGEIQAIEKKVLIALAVGLLMVAVYYFVRRRRGGLPLRLAPPKNAEEKGATVNDQKLDVKP